MKHLSRVSAAPFLVALASSSGPADTKPENDLHIGSSWEFQFAGKPGTGYIWKLDGAASHGLDLVKLKSLGYASRKPGSTSAASKRPDAGRT